MTTQLPTREWLEANATKTTGVTDTEARFTSWTEYAHEGAVYRIDDYGFDKVNPFDRPCSLVTVQLEEGGPISEMAEADLIKTTGVQHDNANEFTCFVEYVLPATGRVVHRSANTMLKRTAEPAASAAGGLS